LWTDSHCHLQDQYRPDDLAVLGAVSEAQQAGVGGLVCVGTDALTSRQAVALSSEIRRAQPGFDAWATIGLHPHEASSGVGEVEAVLVESMADAGDVVVAVGECGLDYHYDHSPRPVQRDAFAAQIALAHRHSLTLVVHTRQAWDDTLDILRTEGVPARTVMHCFTGGADEARRCLDLGAYLSFSGIVTFKNASDVRAAALLCPLDRLLVETDAPFLAPSPHRGVPNRPAWVAVVGEAVAEVKGMAAPDLAAASTAAARRAFARG
jgi:TatD DNase family protein